MNNTGMAERVFSEELAEIECAATSLRRPRVV